MTEQEVISILQRQLLSTEDFLNQLEIGAGFDRSGMQAAREALEALRHAWANCTLVPRDAVLILTYLDEALPQYIGRFPELRDELIGVHFEFIGLVDQLFRPRFLPYEAWPDEEDLFPDVWSAWADNPLPASSLTEEEALSILEQHLCGPEGLVVALRCRAASFNHLGVAKAWRLIHMALETLQPIWAVHPFIPKHVARWLAQVREGMVNGWTLYDAAPTLQGRLAWLADDLGQKVRWCLGGSGDQKYREADSL